MSLQYKHFKVTVNDPSISGGKTQPVALQPEDAAHLPWKLGNLKIDLEGLAEPGSLQGRSPRDLWKCPERKRRKVQSSQAPTEERLG